MSEDRPYEVEAFETVAEVPDLRVIVLTLGPGQCVPWHLHTRITDTFYCLEGPMVVEQQAGVTVLEAGESHRVAPGTPHQVGGRDGGRCRFAIVQGVGAYDFVPVEID